MSNSGGEGDVLRKNDKIYPDIMLPKFKKIVLQGGDDDQQSL